MADATRASFPRLKVQPGSRGVGEIQEAADSNAESKIRSSPKKRRRGHLRFDETKLLRLIAASLPLPHLRIYKYRLQFRLRSRAGEWRKLRAKLGRFTDLWRAGEVELEGSVLLADPNLSCPCLKVEGDLFVDFTSGVGRREYLDANVRRPGEAGLGICLLAAFRCEPCDVDGFNTVRG